MENKENISMNQLVFCPNCGAKNSINGKFCVYCGSSLNIVNQQINNQIKPNNMNNQQINNQINKTNINNQQLNDFTRQIIPENQQNFEQSASNNPKKSPKKFGLLVIFGFMALFSILIRFYYIGIGIFVVILCVYILNDDSQNILGTIFRILGGLFLFGAIILLILFGMCFGPLIFGGY